jgi:hypothetical protein
MNQRVLVASLLSFIAGATLFSSLNGSNVQATIQPPPVTEDREADREAIRAHIGSIFQAFIDWDVDKLYATHSEDWRGYLEGSRVPIKGIEEYMRANGIDWPEDKGTKPQPDPTRTYSMKDFDVKFYGPDLAVACFMGDFEKKGTNPAEVLNRFRIMDLYAKRDGAWIQVASHTVVDPLWRAERMGQPQNVQPQMRERILKAREAVWRAYFTNDQATLEKVIPAETISLDDGSKEWGNRESILASAKRLGESGAKLVRLEFPKTEMQVYGNTVILYTTYLYEVELNGQRKTTTGRGTEIFVRRGNELVNSGWHLENDN